MIWSKLQEMYSARWRPLTEADGWAEWANETADLDESIMLMALDEIVAHRKRLSDDGARDTYPPRLPEVLSTYWRVKAKHEPYVPPTIKCRVCDGTGWGWGIKTSRGYYIIPGRPEARPGEAFYITLIPCTCKSRPDEGYSSNMRRRLAKYIIRPQTAPLSELRRLQSECEQFTIDAEKSLTQEAKYAEVQ